MSLSF